MHALVIRHSRPAFFAKSGCRRCLSTTPAALNPRKLVGNNERIPSEQTANITPSSRTSSRSQEWKSECETSREWVVQRDGVQLSEENARILTKLMHPGGMVQIGALLPLNAAAEILRILETLEEGQQTPQEVVSHVKSIVLLNRSAGDPGFPEIFWRLANSLKRPGETPDAAQNGELIVRLLLTALHCRRRPRTPHTAFVTLFCGLTNRINGDAIMLKHKLDVSKELEWFMSQWNDPARSDGETHNGEIHKLSQAQTPLRHTSQETVGQNLPEMLVKTFHHCNGTAKRVFAARLLGQVYALGSLLPRDIQMAKFWLERAFFVSWKLLGLLNERAAFKLARLHAGIPPNVRHMDCRIFSPKGLQYLQLLKWVPGRAAWHLGTLYFLRPDAEDHTIESHISIHGVMPDDYLAARYFFIGVWRSHDPACKVAYAEMLYLGRAHPPVVSSLDSVDFVPQFPISSESMVEDDRFKDEFDLTASLYEQEPLIEFAPRPRLETLDYAYKLLETLTTYNPGNWTNVSGHHLILTLREKIMRERSESTGCIPASSATYAARSV